MTFIDKLFILINDGKYAAMAINAGAAPLCGQDGVYFFENNQSLRKFCTDNIPAEKYIYTNKMFI